MSAFLNVSGAILYHLGLEHRTHMYTWQYTICGVDTMKLRKHGRQIFTTVYSKLPSYIAFRHTENRHVFLNYSFTRIDNLEAGTLTG